MGEVSMKMNDEERKLVEVGQIRLAAKSVAERGKVSFPEALGVVTKGLCWWAYQEQNPDIIEKAEKVKRESDVGFFKALELSIKATEGGKTLPQLVEGYLLGRAAGKVSKEVGVPFRDAIRAARALNDDTKVTDKGFVSALAATLKCTKDGTFNLGDVLSGVKS